LKDVLGQIEPYGGDRWQIDDRLSHGRRSFRCCFNDNHLGTALHWARCRAGDVHTIKAAARALTQEAIDTLAAVMSDQKAPPAARISAAVAILDRGHGRPSQAVDLNIGCDLGRLTDDELEELEQIMERAALPSPNWSRRHWVQFPVATRARKLASDLGTWARKILHQIEWLLWLAIGEPSVLALMPPMGTDCRRASAPTTGKGGEEICAIAASVTRDGLHQIRIEEAVQGAPERAAVGAFGCLKTTLTDERLDFAVAQLNGHADELAGASMAGEALTFGGEKTRRGAWSSPLFRLRDRRRDLRSFV
jgi:hypothetical protein